MILYGVQYHPSLRVFDGRVAELVYAHDSKSCSARIEGSTPSTPTKCPQDILNDSKPIFFGSES